MKISRKELEAENTQLKKIRDVLGRKHNELVDERNRYIKKSEVLEGKIATIQILLHPQLRNSRFDFNARYIRFDEAQQITEFQKITLALKDAKNFEPYPVGNFTFYRRGTGGLWLYVVPTCDFRVPRERKNHKAEGEKKP